MGIQTLLWGPNYKTVCPCYAVADKWQKCEIKSWWEWDDNLLACRLRFCFILIIWLLTYVTLQNVFESWVLNSCWLAHPEKCDWCFPEKIRPWATVAKMTRLTFYKWRLHLGLATKHLLSWYKELFHTFCMLALFLSLKQKFFQFLKMAISGIVTLEFWWFFYFFFFN